MFTKFTEVWASGWDFSVLPLGNGIVERSHCTINHIATIMEAVYWYKITPKDDTTALTVLPNSVHIYQAHTKVIDVVPSHEHTHPRIYKGGDSVWVTTLLMVDVLHNSKKEQWQGSIDHIPFLSIEHHAISETCLRHRSASSEDDSHDRLSENDSNAPVFQCRAR